MASEDDPYISFFVGEFKDISRYESDRNKTKLCDSVAKNNLCDFHPSCSFSHHPSMLFAVQHTFRSVNSKWTSDEYQKWILKYHYDPHDDVHVAEKKRHLFQRVLDNPAPSLVLTINRYKDAKRNYDDGAQRAKYEEEKRQYQQQIKKEKKRNGEQNKLLQMEAEKLKRAEMDRMASLRRDICSFMSLGATDEETSERRSRLRTFFAAVTTSREFKEHVAGSENVDLSDVFTSLVLDSDLYAYDMEQLDYAAKLLEVMSKADNLKKLQDKMKSMTDHPLKKREARAKKLEADLIKDYNYFFSKRTIFEELNLRHVCVAASDESKTSSNETGGSVCEESGTPIVSGYSATDDLLSTSQLGGMEGEDSAIEPGAEPSLSTLAHPVFLTRYSYDRYIEVCGDKLGEASKMSCCKTPEGPPVLACKQCVDRKFCCGCVKNHLKKKHHYRLVCPLCGDYDDLLVCEDCACDSCDFLACSECHKDRHNQKGMHDFKKCSWDAVAAIVGSSNSTTSPASPVLPSPTPHPVLATFTTSLPSPPPMAVDSTPVPDHIREQLNMASARTLVEDVVHPVLYQLFRTQWLEGNCWCVGCRTTHEFECIKLSPCIEKLICSLPDTCSAVRALEISAKRDVSALNFAFDATSLCQIIKCWMNDTAFSKNMLYCSFDILNLFIKWRNKTFHPKALNDADFTECFSLVPKACENIITEMKKNVMKKNVNDSVLTKWLMEFDLANKVQMCIDCRMCINIADYVQREWVKESKRTDLAGYTAILRSGHIDLGVSSKEVGERLLSQDGMKMLIIPILETGFDKSQYQFLSKVAWAGIMDLNSSDPVWTEDEYGDFYPMEVIGPKEDVVVMSASDLNAYGSSKTRYVHSMLYLPGLTQGAKDIQFYVVGFGRIDKSKLSLEKLLINLEMIMADLKSDEPNSRLSMLWPLVENHDFLHATDYLRHPDMTNLDKFAYARKVVCSMSLVSAMVFGRQKKDKAVILLRSLVKETFVGIQTKLLDDFKCVEILSIGNDTLPFYSPADELEEVDLEDESTDAFKRMKATEISRFLMGGVASWYMIAKNWIVARTQALELAEMIDYPSLGVRFTQLTLVHSFGAGGTTVARQTLYDLWKKGWVCLVMHKAIRDHMKTIKFADLLKHLNEVTGHRIVILVDLKKDVAELYASFIAFINNVKQNVSQFCTFLVTTTDAAWIPYFPHHSDQSKASQDTRAEECVKLKPTSDAEVNRFMELIAEARPPLMIRNTEFIVDKLGFLDINSIMRSSNHLKIIRQSSDHELREAGLTGMDIHNVRQRVGIDELENEEDNNPLSCGDEERFRAKFHISSPYHSPGIPFYGILAFIPKYREYAKNIIGQITNKGFSPKELIVLKLCVFYGLFAPSCSVPCGMAAYFYVNNGTIPTKRVPWSKNFTDLVDIDNIGNLKVKNFQLAYILAEIPCIFGFDYERDEGHQKYVDPGLRISGSKVRSYIFTELFTRVLGKDGQIEGEHLLSSISSNTTEMQRKRVQERLLKDASDGFVNAFCDFKTWHPGSKPKPPPSPFGAGKQDWYDESSTTLHNSFAVTLLLLATKRTRDNFDNVRTVFEKLIYHFSCIPKLYSTFSTHAARIIAYEGQQQKDVALIAEAKCLVENLEEGFQVCDCLGNIYKRLVLIYLKSCHISRGHTDEDVSKPSAEDVSTNKVESKATEILIEDSVNNADSSDCSDDEEHSLAAEDDELDVLYGYNSDDSDDNLKISQPHRRVPSALLTPDNSTLIDRLTLVFNAAKDAHLWFSKAIAFSKSVNTFPMIAAVQTWVYFLEFLRNILFEGDQDNFVKAYQKPPRNNPIIGNFLLLVREIQPLDKCNFLLSKARNSLLHKPMASGYEHHNRHSMSYIKKYRKRLINFTQTREQQKLPVGRHFDDFLDTTRAKNLLIEGRSTVLDVETLVYCMITCSVSLVKDSPGIKSTDMEMKSPMTAFVTVEDESSTYMSFYETIEKFFVASSLLSKHAVSGVDIITDTDRFVGMVSSKYNIHAVWDADFLREHICNWIVAIKNEHAVVSPFHSERAIECSMSREFGNMLTGDSLVAEVNIDTRSFYGIEAHFCLVALNLWQAIFNPGDSRVDCVDKLRRSLYDLHIFSEGCQYAQSTRMLLTKISAVPNNPFACFIHIDDWPFTCDVRRLRGRKIEQEQIYVENGNKSLKRLHGVYEQIETKRGIQTVVQCDLLNEHVIYCDYKAYLNSDLKIKDRVTFYVGITNRGIWAHGLSKVKSNKKVVGSVGQR